jgi:hypothetical protein
LDSCGAPLSQPFAFFLWHLNRRPRRIFIENAISGIKRFNILVLAFRNSKTNKEDGVCRYLRWSLGFSDN